MPGEQRFKFLNLLEQSYLFIALCAALLAIQSYLISETTVQWTAVIIVFFSTLAVYNLSVISLHISYTKDDSLAQLRINGNKFNIFLFVISLPVILLLLPGCSHLQALVFLIASMLVLLYMKPIQVNGHKWHGVRRNWLVKNILLSMIWALATVLLPLVGDGSSVTGSKCLTIFSRNFFFIYALTVIYDLRDIRSDSYEGMKTLAMISGVNGAKTVAIGALLVFTTLAFIDSNLSAEMKSILMLSALASVFVVTQAGPPRTNTFYCWAVDGMMALKAVLIILVH